MEFIPFWAIWMVVICFANCVKGQIRCKPASIQDIADAAHLSVDMYGNSKEGDEVSDVPGYVIRSVIKHGYASNSLIVGEPLKVVVAKRESPPSTMIVFMGTRSAEQLYKQLTTAVFKKAKTATFNGEEVGVMEYFWNAFQQLWPKLQGVDISDNMKYIVTGHSLGGAIASLYAIKMVEMHNGALWKSPDSALITFGQPRVGDQSYATLHDKLIPPFRKLRLIYDLDVVPHLPPYNFFIYRHASREIWIEKEQKFWKKVGWIWLPWFTTEIVWHVCPNGDSKKCSNKKYKLRIKDHFMSSYIKEIEGLKKDTTKLNIFEKGQC